MTEFDTISHFGPPLTSDSAVKTIPPSNPISLEEYETSKPFEISPEDVAFLESLHATEQVTPLRVSFTSEGKAVIKTGSHVGVLTLPSGVQIEVTPKQTVTRLLWALKYAFDTPVDALDIETEFTSASSFFDVLGVLFHAELQSILQQGLHRDYVRTRSVREHVRGRIDVQRQLQRPSIVPTDFAVEHDEFTADNHLNRAVLAALRVLLLLVRDDALSSRLQYQAQRLREFVSVERVSLSSVERLELTRLNDHYEALLGLTRLILARDFFEDVRAGERRSLALFVNMNSVFEQIVERAFRSVARDIGSLRVSGQASIPNIVTGPHAVKMRPDVLVAREDGTPVLVADAKWKTGSTSSGDIYQLSSYILALETPGILVYPERGQQGEKKSQVMEEHSLRSVELATNTDATTYDEYVAALEASARRCLETIEEPELV
ncbi:McrC family protein [Haloprofundus marisrubri]|uniref:McrC family protein n=1 Tax=Haloprofundus marisrubri TaxID=1514971 RepID=UPI00138F2CAB|nr:hypothetical protein [Haloprofundus marisrubri]